MKWGRILRPHLFPSHLVERGHFHENFFAGFAHSVHELRVRLFDSEILSEQYQSRSVVLQFEQLHDHSQHLLPATRLEGEVSHVDFSPYATYLRVVT